MNQAGLQSTLEAEANDNTTQEIVRFGLARACETYLELAKSPNQHVSEMARLTDEIAYLYSAALVLGFSPSLGRTHP